MTWVAAAIIGGAVIGAGASAYSANRAAGAASDASRRATDAELQMYNQSREDLAPYREAGTGALDMISQLYGIPGADGQAPAQRDLSSFYTSPNYEFVRSEGLRGVTNSRAAMGSGSGGNAIRGAERFAGNLASGEFQNYVDHLFAVAGMGSGATQVGVQAGQNTANSLANIYTNEGNARGSAYMSGAAGVNSSIQGGLQNWAFQNYLNSGASPAAAPQGGYAYGGAPGNRNP